MRLEKAFQLEDEDKQSLKLLTAVSDRVLVGVGGDGLHSVGLDGDVSLHQGMFLQQVLHTQQVFPVVLRQQQHLQAERRVRAPDVLGLNFTSHHSDYGSVPC